VKCKAVLLAVVLIILMATPALAKMLNHSLEDQLILHEGLRLEVYKCPAGYWTVGVGRNLQGKPLSKEEQEYIFKRSGLAPDEVIEVLKERGITKDEALFLLRRDIEDAVQDLKNFDWVRGARPHPPEGSHRHEVQPRAHALPELQKDDRCPGPR